MSLLTMHTFARYFCSEDDNLNNNNNTADDDDDGDDDGGDDEGLFNDVYHTEEVIDAVRFVVCIALIIPHLQSDPSVPVIDRFDTFGLLVIMILLSCLFWCLPSFLIIWVMFASYILLHFYFCVIYLGAILDTWSENF